MLSYTQQKAGVHLRAAPGLEPNRGASSSSKPMMEKALAFRLKQHPSTINASGERALHDCCTPTGRFCCKACDWLDPFCEGRVSEFAAYGSGQTSYFKLLKLLSWAFLLMTLCAVPPLLINVNGRGKLGALNALTLAATTIGNMGAPSALALGGGGNATAAAAAAAANASALLTAQFSDIPGWALVVPRGTPLTPTLVALIYSGCDLVACVVLFAAYLALRAGERQEQRQVNKATITADDYTVFLPNPPPHATEALLKAHFEDYLRAAPQRPPNHPPDFAVVEEVHVVEDDTTLVQLYVKRGKLRRRAERLGEALRGMEEALAAGAGGEGGGGGGCCCYSLAARAARARARREALGAEMAALTRAAQAHVATHSRYAVAAFVTLRHQAAREWLVEAYEGGWLAWACQARAQRLPRAPPPPGARDEDADAAAADPRAPTCCCANHLTVVPAASPTAVIWTNLHVTRCEHGVRQAITGSLALALLALSFGALWFASSQTAALQQAGALASCSGGEGGGSALALAARAPFAPALAALHGAAVPPANATKYCTCAAMGWASFSAAALAAPYASSGRLQASDCPFQACPRWLEVDPPGAWAQAFCQSWLWSRSYAAVIVVGAAVLVLGINTGLGYVMRVLTLVEGHHSWEALNSSLALRLFVATALNTGLLVVMINVAWPFVVPSAYFATGKYGDFVPSWYDNVGTSLLTTMVINIVTPHLYNLVCGVRYCCFVRSPSLRAPTQRDLNRLVLGPNNDPSIRYAQIFNTLFVCFVFSTGLPLMLPIAAASFILFFWVDKLAFMWYYRRPPAYSVSLQQTLSALLPLALLLHLGVGLWMLSASSIFAAVDLSGVAAYADPMAAQLVALSGRNSYVSAGVARVSAQGVLPILVCLILVALWMAAQVLWVLARHTCSSALHLATCGQCLRGGSGSSGGGSGGGSVRNWDLNTPTYRASLERAETRGGGGRGKKGGAALMRLTMQGRESYNMLLDPEIMYAFGITYEWAKTHRVADLAALEHAGSGGSASSPTGFAPVHPLGGGGEEQRNPLGPPALQGIYGDVYDEGEGSGDSVAAVEAAYYDEEDALEMEDEGAGAGIPPSYGISARRLGMSPEEISSHNAYNRAGPVGYSV